MATEMISLYVLQYYRCRNIEYQPGVTIQVDPETAVFLQRDAPGCFAPVNRTETQDKSILYPPADKQIKSPAKAKGKVK